MRKLGIFMELRALIIQLCRTLREDRCCKVIAKAHSSRQNCGHIKHPYSFACSGCVICNIFVQNVEFRTSRTQSCKILSLPYALLYQRHQLTNPDKPSGISCSSCDDCRQCAWAGMSFVECARILWQRSVTDRQTS